MIAKMKFVNVIGPKEEMDEMVESILSRYDIQLENAMTELKSMKNLSPCVDSNPYTELLEKAKELVAMCKQENPLLKTVSIDEAMQVIHNLEEQRESYGKEKHRLTKEKEQLEQALQEIEPYRNIDYNIQDILDFKWIKFRFGKVPVKYFDNLERYTNEEASTIFYKCQGNKEYVYGVYFVPVTESEKVDAAYASMHFERFYMPDNYKGTMVDAFADYSNKLEAVAARIEALDKDMENQLGEHTADILAAEKTLEKWVDVFEVRKKAAYVHSDNETFFILCGWMEQKDAEKFEKEVEEHSRIFCIEEDGEDYQSSKAPTKLKNPKFFRPFEMFIKMYGLPDYDEFDPTIFVALTYSFIFGIMFGDVGQGALLLIGGALLYKFKKMDLAGIISRCGIFSIVFGFMFGSVFGFEDVFEPLWLRPVSAMSNVPFIGKLNTVFVVAIGFGMGLMLLTMIFHIINGLRQKDLESALFDTNGVAGLVFYGALVAVVALFVTGKKLPGGIVLAVMFIVPLLVMAMKEPIMAIITKKSEKMPKEKGMFFVQAFFELFEVLLSYFSNTLSFVRIGAFAVSHAAMMEVVLMLAGATEGGSPNWLVIVLGNLFVCGMEGLIVGIQVLRLQYYEFFSRFYKGGGREFKPYKAIK